MRRTLVGALLGWVVIAGCGADGDGRRVSTGPAPVPESLAGLAVSNSYTAALVNLGDADVAVIDGSANVGGTLRLVVTWTDDGERWQSAADDLPALVFPTAWWSDPFLFVFGLECPRVDLDLVGDFDSYPVEEVCGAGSREVVRRLDSGTGDWITVRSSWPRESNSKVFLQAAAGDRALLRAVGHGLLILDASTGAVEDLGQVPRLDASGASEACPLADGDFMVSFMTTPDPDLVGSLEVWLIRDGAISPADVPTEGAPAEAFSPFDCIPGRGIFGRPSGGVLDLLTVRSGDALAWDTIDLPATAKRENGRVQLNGPSLIVWVPEDKTLIPWRQAGGTWIQAGARYDHLDPPDDPVLAGDQLLGLVTSYDDGRTTTVVAI